MVVDKDGRPQVAPTVHSGKFLPPQNRYALCGFYFVYLDRKSGAEIFSPTPLYYFFYCCVLLFLYLHRLVGLRLLRLCPFLVSEVEQEIYSAWALPLDPTSPLTPGLSLRFSARYARCWVHNSGQLCSFLIPHSSLLIPHSSLLTYDIASSISFTSSPNIASASLIG